jgi:hypothetical protein
MESRERAAEERSKKRTLWNLWEGIALEGNSDDGNLRRRRLRFRSRSNLNQNCEASGPSGGVVAHGALATGRAR